MPEYSRDKNSEWGESGLKNWGSLAGTLQSALLSCFVGECQTVGRREGSDTLPGTQEPTTEKSEKDLHDYVDRTLQSVAANEHHEGT
jgi:hypothetical protein